MKNLYILLLFSLFATSARAQTPVAFNYQAIARDMNDQPYRGEEMEVGISITDADGNEVYGEEHNVRTNSLGIFNIMVGKGDKTSNNSLAVLGWSPGGPLMLGWRLHRSSRGSEAWSLVCIGPVCPRTASASRARSTLERGPSSRHDSAYGESSAPMSGCFATLREPTW